MNNVADAYTQNYVENGTTGQFTATVTPKTPAGGHWSYTSSDTGVATVDNSGKLTFTGKEGTTTVEASYTWTQDGEEYTLTDKIEITAVPVTFTIDILDNGSSVDTVTVKSITDGMTYSLNYSLKKNGAYGASDHTAEQGSILWEVESGEDILSLSNETQSTATLTFTGKEGEATVRVTYTAPNGDTYTDVVTVRAKLGANIEPSDSKEDFPDYPNEGSVRLDKTATAVGSFSQTGTAQVELSMTGVPYTSGSEVDVVIMVDMSGSMNAKDNDDKIDRVTPAQDAVKEALEALVTNEDGSFNNNRVAIYTFAESIKEYYERPIGTSGNYKCDLQTFDSTSLNKAKTGIGKWSAGDGTDYSVALKKCYETLATAKKEEGYNRKQYVIFVTDGAPTRGFTYRDSNGNSKSYGSSYNSSGQVYMDGQESSKRDADLAKNYTEYYSYEMKKAGVEVYSIGIQLSSDNKKTILKKIAGVATKDEENKTVIHNATEENYSNYAMFVGTDVSELEDFFRKVVQEIKQAATNVTVTDKVADEYSMVFTAPSGVDLGGQELYIQAVEYQLDGNKERTGDPEVLEKFSYDGSKWVHLVKGTACGDSCTHVTAEGSNVTAIEGTYFTYNAKTKVIQWKADKLSTTELALQYFVYLDNSAEVDVENQVEAGTYPTNDYATMVYTNHLDHVCQQSFPVPQMTWNGAQVSYVFYLVNEDGKPVNLAGQEIPFARAVFVTDPVTYAVTWNDENGNKLEAKYLAKDYLPSVYTLYDENTGYNINVYETETESKNSFEIIEGKGTTYVYNTMASTKYSTAGKYTESNVYSGFDFANTTVAFAVKWVPELVEDIVVIDYGLDVVIDVAKNDSLNGSVVGVRADKPAAEINKGQFTAAKAKEATLTYGTATVENDQAVRYSLNRTNGMEMNAPETFYYESDVSFAGTSGTVTTSMYSSVTVIPATTVYYEDEYVTLKTWTGEDTYENGWTVNSTLATKSDVQDTDRPGEDLIGASYDADNVYGYDSHYETMSGYSLNHAAMATVSEGTWATAEFTFYGTGFDVISKTSSTTGTIVVQVYKDGETEPFVTKLVDTYYGYSRVDGQWVQTNGINDLYQVPVMKIVDLDYGKYKAVITASYVDTFDHNDKDSYDFYLDAIRIYDPVDPETKVDDDTTVGDIYVMDGEGYPVYEELRNNVIAAGTLNEADAANGIVFVDGNKNASLADYQSVGPNNELYLAPGQSIAFKLNEQYKSNAVDIQLGIKTVGNNGAVKGTVELFNAGSTTTSEDEDDLDAGKTMTTSTTVYGAQNKITKTIGTATDMYYSISSLNRDGVIVIKNAGESTDPVISLTNIKFTYASKENVPASGAAGASVFTVTAADAALTLNTLNGTSDTVTTESIWENPFEDVPVDAWYLKELVYLVHMGVVNGFGNVWTFAPKAEATRAMVVQTLWKLETGGKKWTATHNFVDVASDAWYANAVAWAYDAGIVNGTGDGTTFSPDNQISRGEIICMLYRYAQYKGWDVSKTESLSRFADGADVPEWARPALEWATANGIINGIPKEDGYVYVESTGTLTREQMVAFLYRTMIYGKRGEVL